MGFPWLLLHRGHCCHWLLMALNPKSLWEVQSQRPNFKTRKRLMIIVLGLAAIVYSLVYQAKALVPSKRNRAEIWMYMKSSNSIKIIRKSNKKRPWSKKLSLRAHKHIFYRGSLKSSSGQSKIAKSNSSRWRLARRLYSLTKPQERVLILVSV